VKQSEEPAVVSGHRVVDEWLPVGHHGNGIVNKAYLESGQKSKAL
jgi:hypothetical protein